MSRPVQRCSCCTNYCDYCCDILLRTTAHYYCRLLLITRCYCGLLHAINYILMTIDYYESPSTALQLLHQLLRLLLRYTAADYWALLLSAVDYTLLLWTIACYQLHINDH